MEFPDILYEKQNGMARIIINRPKVDNAFRTNTTLKEMFQALEDSEIDSDIRVVVL